MTTPEAIVTIVVALAALAQTVVNAGMKLRQDMIEQKHDQLETDLKDFAAQLKNCLEGTAKPE